MEGFLLHLSLFPCMRLHLDNTGLDVKFFPLTSIKKFEDLRTGLFSFKERWLKLAEKQNYPLEIIDDSTKADKTFPSNFIPSADLQLTDFFDKNSHLKDAFIHIEKLWHLTNENINLLKSDIDLLNLNLFNDRNASIQQTGKNPLFIHQTARIEHCHVDSSDGPVVIDEDAHVMSGAMLRGPIYIGKKAVVKMGATLYSGTNIGHQCTIGGEVKNSIFHSFSNKAHHGYIGDSYIGSWCNLGAGTTGSNLKNTFGPIRIWENALGQYSDGPTKAGVYMGDHVKTAINTSFSSGTVISSFVNIFTQKNLPVPKYVHLFSWGIDDQKFYDLEKLLVEMRRWMKMKDQNLSSNEREAIISLYKSHIK